MNGDVDDAAVVIQRSLSLPVLLSHNNNEERRTGTMSREEEAAAAAWGKSLWFTTAFSWAELLFPSPD